MILLISALFAIVVGQSPIMDKKDMFFLGPDSSQVHMDFVIDFQCPDSAQAWPTILSLVHHVYPQKLQVRVMEFPLPYHHNAMFAAQAARVVAKLNGTKQAYFDYAAELFKTQDSWGDTATQNMPPMTVITQLLAPLAAKCCGVNPSQFYNEMGWVSPQNIIARAEWKNCAAMGAYGTPAFFVNGIQVSMDAGASVEDWKKLLDPLVH